MRLRDLIRAWGGELMLVTLAVFRLLCSFPGVSLLYRTLLARLVDKTGLFDEQFYRDNNPDIAEAGMKGVWHYALYGDKEDRSPMPFFDPHYYRHTARGWTTNVNSLLHYSYVGRFRRISPSPWFDVKFYLKTNKDVARAGLDPIIHYMEWGGIEGRWPSAHFDSAYYLETNPDVGELNINPLLHYLRYGRCEGRRCLPESYERTDGILLMAERPKPVLPGEKEWEGLQAQASSFDAEVDVVIPVYRGMVETLRCIYSVLSVKCSVKYELIVINDDSPDAQLVEKLNRLAQDGLFTLISNEKNKGFVKTANLGMQLHALRDVVLLNSDTEVYDGWLDRLKSAADRDARTGTVTPLSNNATICSYPNFPEENPFPLEIEYEELNALVGEINAGLEVEAPTGVGFCMYITRQCLKGVGFFDEKAFGKGYGEENDFCQRAIKKGWRNVIAADVFVRHFGSVSFQGEKAKLSERSLRVMEKKHKNYLRDVAAFIKQRPLADIYRQIDMARLLRMRRERNVLLISHGRGGGTERYLQEDISRLLAEGMGVFVMRPLQGDSERVTIGHHAIRELPNLASYSWRKPDSVKMLLKELGIVEVHANSFVDYCDEAPVVLKDLIDAMGIRLQVHVHDYEAICPRINLVDDHGRYCGEPDYHTCNRCLSELGTDFMTQDITVWRKQHEAFLMSAEKVVVPDDDVEMRLKKYFPRVTVDVCPHDDTNDKRLNVRLPVIEFKEKLKVVVVGAVSKMKGYDVLLNCARDARRRNLPIEYHLLGYSLNDKALESEGVKVAGKYMDSEAMNRLRKLQPHVVLLPSIAPETYSYTLSLAMRSGYPIFAFDIGAIASRLRAQGQLSGLMPYVIYKDEKKVNQILMSFRDSVLEVEDQVEVESDEFEGTVVAAYD